ncbi:ATP-binding protein [bacterium]|nr:ATP-binding protein [bacterium]NUN45833.1 hypothetical protein [bacterium]
MVTSTPMHPLKKLTLIFFVLLMPSSNVSAQIKIHRSVNVEQGLVQSQVTAITRDRWGYVWIGTLGGLSRWDGVRFQNFQTQDGLAGGQISALHEYHDGSMYIGTDGGGLSVYRDGRFTTLNKDSGLCDNRVWNIIPSGDSALWICTYGGGVSFYQPQRRSWKTIGLHEGLPDLRVYTGVHADNDVWWFGTDSGVAILSPQTQQRITARDGLIHPIVRSIRRLNDSAWALGTREGLSVYINGRCTNYTTRDGLADNDINAMLLLQNGALCIATANGISLWHHGVFENLTTANGLANDLVWNIYEDYDRTLYFGTNGGGVSMYRPGRLTTWRSGKELPDAPFTTVTQRRDGSMVFGSHAGLITMRGDKPEILDEKKGLAHNLIWSLFEDRRGRLWIGTHNGIHTVTDGRVTATYRHSDKPMNRAYGMTEDADGNMILATRGGLAKVENRQIVPWATGTPLSGQIVWCARTLRDGRMAFGSDGAGLFIYDGSQFKNISQKNGLAGDFVVSIYEAPDGLLCVGTDGGGLSLIRDGVIRNFDTKNGLRDNTIYAITGDARGAIYAASNRGMHILSFSGGDTLIRTIRRSDGLAGDECSLGGVCTDQNGRVWVATVNGMTEINPSSDSLYTVPQTRIHRLRVYENSIPVVAHTAFRHDENYLKFDFIGIYPSAPEQVRYRYRLQGLDAQWIPTTERTIQYTNLASGDYTFEVQSANDWGVWSPTESLVFTITPPFWKTWWFRLILVLAVIGLLWVIYRIRVTRLLAMERMRVRIASDLHDDIGSTLTRIAVSSESIRSSDDLSAIRHSAERIGQLSRDVIRTFSDIVWSIDARNDRMGDLIARLQDTAYQVLNTAEIACTWDVHGIRAEESLAVDVRQNVFLIVKEVLHNAAKHSGATSVHVRIERTDRGLIISLRDNGRGIPDERIGKGNGLRNMRMRAERVRGRIKQINDNGAVTEIFIPL